MNENKKKLEDLLIIIKRLKKELEESYLILKNSFNPLKNINIFDDKRIIIKEITEKIKNLTQITDGGENSENDDDNNEIKELLKAEILKIAEINEAFSGLIKKNICYNQLTISFITDSFNKCSIYDRAGGNDSNFLPLKNVLIKFGVRA